MKMWIRDYGVFVVIGVAFVATAATVYYASLPGPGEPPNNVFRAFMTAAFVSSFAQYMLSSLARRSDIERLERKIDRLTERMP